MSVACLLHTCGSWGMGWETKGMILLGNKKEIIAVLSDGKGARTRHALACFGRKRHYRKDGSCKHTDALLSKMRPWHRARTDLTPFGGGKEGIVIVDGSSKVSA